MTLDQLKDELDYWKWIAYDTLYKLTKNERFYRYLDETPVRNQNLSLLWLDESERFNFSIPWDEEKKGEEWFLLTDAQSRFKTTKVARIKFHSHEYFEIGKYYGVKPWILEKQEKKDLTDFLKSPYGSNLTHWQMLIDQYNAVHSGQENIPIPMDLPIPDYTKLPNY